MNTAIQAQPAPGDYHGVIYEGNLVLPVLVLIVLATAIWWFIRIRKSAK